jgi:hypothetical protein
MNAYHDKLIGLEKQTLQRPKMTTVKARRCRTGVYFVDIYHMSSVHIISGDLILHKRTIEPLKQLIYGLRRYDLDRCVALAQGTAPEVDKAQVKGYMSHKAKVYLVSRTCGHGLPLDNGCPGRCG